MNLWQINIPLNDNAGARVMLAHRKFAEYLAAAFGGFTSWEANGAWRDPETNGGVQFEPVRIYEIAAEGEPDLVGIAKQFFPDQKAFFVGRVGEASIINV